MNEAVDGVYALYAHPWARSSPTLSANKGRKAGDNGDRVADSPPETRKSSATEPHLILVQLLLLRPLRQSSDVVGDGLETSAAYVPDQGSEQTVPDAYDDIHVELVVVPHKRVHPRGVHLGIQGEAF